MIPRDTFDDVVLGNPIVIKSDSSDPGGIVVDLSGDVDAVVGEDGNKVPSEVIVADGGNGGSLDTVLRDVIDEVGGCASRFSAVREHIPQQFSDGDYGWFGGVGHGDS